MAAKTSRRFAQWITRERKARGWTREELAGFLRVDQANLWKWEQGKALPSLNRFSALCCVLTADANKVLRLIAHDDGLVTTRDDDSRSSGCTASAP